MAVKNYAHLSSNLASPYLAVSLLREMESLAYDLEVTHSPFGWTKSYNVKVKGHPLAESSKVITKKGKSSAEDSTEEVTSEALKSESKIKSFWHIMTPDGVMTPISDFDFSHHPKLEILSKYESAKKCR